MWPNEIFVLIASRTSADALHQHWILNLISVYLMCDLSLFRVLSLEGTGLDCRWASCPVWRDQTQQRQPLRLCTYRSVLWLPFMAVQLCTVLWILFVCLVILWAEGWKNWDDVILWWHRAMYMGPVWDPRGPWDNPRGFGLLGLLENKLVRVGESVWTVYISVYLISLLLFYTHQIFTFCIIFAQYFHVFQKNIFAVFLHFHNIFLFSICTVFHTFCIIWQNCYLILKDL